MSSLEYYTIVGIVLVCVVSATNEEITRPRENLLRELMNSTADPCTDFHEYACGNFQNLYSIPDHLGQLDTRTRLNEENIDHLMEKLSAPVSNDGNLSAKDKAKLFYASCNDTSTIDSRGRKPILDLLKSLGGWPVLEKNWENKNFDWIKLVINMMRLVNENYLFYVGFMQDMLTLTKKYLPVFDRPYTTISGDQDLYRERIRKTLKAFDVEDELANETAYELLDFEEKLTSLFEIDGYRQVIAPISEFQNNYTMIDWSNLLSAIYDIDLPPSESMISLNTLYFVNLSEFISNSPAKAVTNYVLWKFVDDMLPMLSSEFREIVDKHKQAEKPFTTPLPRERQCVDIVAESMTKVTAAIFMEGKISKDSENKIIQLADDLKSTIRDAVEKNTWMGDKVKSTALQRLDALILDTSYFDLLHDNSTIDREYSGVNITTDEFLETYLGLERAIGENLVRLYRENSSEFSYTFPLFHAEASYLGFEGVLLLQPGLIQMPFYHDNFQNFFLFGGLGFIAGHEISHWLDVQNSKYDPEQGYISWWDFTDFEIFQERTRCIVDQYNSYNLHNISLEDRTLGDGENIADNMGLKFAYEAYDNWLNISQSPENGIIDGFDLTGRQMFFISAAQSLCANIRPEAVSYHITNEPHSPGSIRVNGMMANSRHFAEQFHCEINSTMNPEEKCDIL